METVTLQHSAVVYFCYYMIKYDFVIINQEVSYSNYKYIYEFISFITFHSSILILPHHISSLDTSQDIYSLQYLISSSNNINNYDKVYRFNNNDLYYIHKRFQFNNQSIENNQSKSIIEANFKIIDYRSISSSLSEDISNSISQLSKIAQIKHSNNLNYHSQLF